MNIFSKLFLKVLYRVKVGGKCLYSERIYSRRDNAKNKSHCRFDSCYAAAGKVL